MTIPTTDLKTMLDQATPGPWEADIDHERNLGTVNVVPDDTHYGVTTAANARLIAAAPDLAAEVIRLREGIEALAKHVEANSCAGIVPRLRTLLGDQS